MNDEARESLENAVHRFALSFRAIKKVQKVARTIADLDQNQIIGKKDILEALSYRHRQVYMQGKTLTCKKDYKSDVTAFVTKKPPITSHANIAAPV